ncbi:tRNA pseudouridine(38/39) synthase [Malassezia vespertilionis]|uniref:Pseudouridine synthase I TruA alpha/beta domain-containing protein n=1 Tax=Malassezia vespertilionis TaxID=2020962 RepID=A0A2N1JFQ3_9BASI|nr:tRNA pseudouridine(38/39) synthase [Malassezia vespertilionis]PKI85368.1 hypothetical protein MVES_000548 [Malassezia vespertilionis]WFD05263.1 tRNA pseudouridine(38/39) synthase [Malassezia vespertilionis]
MSAYERYNGWSRAQLLRRIMQLEAGEVLTPEPNVGPTAQGIYTHEAEKAKSKKPRPYDVSAQASRKIALRFCYDGAYYSGLAAQSSQVTPLPTVEETIWDAMCIARLVDPEKGMEGAGWSRCGRTDAGVSAAGQVVALWVRSRSMDERTIRSRNEETPVKDELDAMPVRISEEEELPYVATLNRLLPPTIRIQAWSPVSPHFSSRFDCQYRHYKYFFTLGAPHSLTWQRQSSSHFPKRLDITRMRKAAARLVGEHDFRNLCKVDASKQITNFVRRIDGATIDEVAVGWPTTQEAPVHLPVTPANEPMFVLNLRGSAFLYHQVRNIVAVLFMVGAGLEEPTIMDALINVRPGAVLQDHARTINWILSLPDDATPDKILFRALGTPANDLTVFETKPSYEMAADRPLMLWECGFLPTHVSWRADTYDGPFDAISSAKEYTPTLKATSQLHAQWTQTSIHAELYRHFVLSSASTKTSALPSQSTFAAACTPMVPAPADQEPSKQGVQLVPLGNGATRPTTRYIPLTMRPRDVSYEVKNEKWRTGKGKRRAEKKAASGAAQD